MQVWVDLLRSSPPLAVSLALLFFGNGMAEKVGKVPVVLQDWFTYLGPVMMIVGGIGLVLILPHTVFRLYKNKATSPTPHL